MDGGYVRRYESMCINKIQELVKLPKKRMLQVVGEYKMKDGVLEKNKYTFNNMKSSRNQIKRILYMD